MTNTSPQKQKEHLNICSINICGLSQRSQLALDHYADQQHLDIIAVQETGTEVPSLSNMNMLRDSNKAANKGCALFLRDCYSMTNLPQIATLSKQIDTVWCLCVFGAKRIIIGTIYLKLSYGKGVKELNLMLEAAKAEALRLKAAGVILCGDLNSRHTVWHDTTTNQYGKDLIESIDHLSFSISSARTPSFLAVNGSSNIDLFITSNTLSNQLLTPTTDVEVELFSGAPLRGHVPVLARLMLKVPATATFTERISLMNADWGKWRQDLEGKISHLDLTDEPTKIWIAMQVALDETLNSHGVKKLITSHSKPFWTRELSEMSKELRDAKKGWYCRNTDFNLERMTAARKIFDDTRMKECKRYLLEKTSLLNTSQCHQFWKNFNKIFGKRESNSVDPLDDGKGGLITDNQQKEEVLFSTFFGGKHLDENQFDDVFHAEVTKLYEEEKLNDFVDVGSDELDDDLLNREISMEEIKDTIKNYEIGGKSFDNLNFHPTMLKNLGKKALHTLHQLFNTCLNKGCWLWGEGEVIFLRKSDKSSYADPASYRPITISSYIGKLFEKIIAARLELFLFSIGEHDVDQEGFTRGRNTVRYLNRLHMGIKADIEKKLTVLVLFLDFEKAFDSVPKKSLIFKLCMLGVRGKILKLLNSFLFDRRIKLSFNNFTGLLRLCLEFGLPQGSALSPILFRIFVLDLFLALNGIPGIEKMKFADDGSVKAAHVSPEECIKIMGLILKEVDDWSRKWRMVINCKPNKTEIICFNVSKGGQDKIPKVFKLGGKDILLVEKTKVLGVIFDNKLSFKEHSRMVYNKLTYRWVTVCKYTNRNWGFCQEVMVQLIKTIFQACLFYASHIWMKDNNMQDISRLWYKLVKSSVGAVLNIRRSLAEVILGIPPIMIMNKVSKVKHYLKLSQNATPWDTLAESVSMHIQLGQSVVVHTAMRDVFEFLKWKCEMHPSDFSEQDKEIVRRKELSEFFEVSLQASFYTKAIMTEYTEHLWQSSIRNEYLLDGYNTFPTPKCAKLPLTKGTSRESEVLVMSMFYDNNLLNSSLYKVNPSKFKTAGCECGRDTQTAYHVLMECTLTDPTCRRCCFETLLSALSLEAVDESHITLLNASRSPSFISSVLSALENTAVPLRKKVILAASQTLPSDTPTDLLNP